MEMTHRERIVEAINHRPTDVLPIDFGAMRSTGISILAYDKLRHYLKLDNGLPKMYDVFQQLAEPETAVLDRLGGDVVQAHRLCPAFELSIKQWKETTLPGGVRCMVPAGYNPRVKEDGSQEILDEDGQVVARMPSSGLYFDSTVFPLEHVETEADLQDLSFPVITEEEICFIEEECRTLYETTDRAILFAFGGNILEAGEGMFGFEKFFEFLLCEPEIVHAWATKLTDSYIASLEALLPRIAPYINIIQFGDDLGTQQSTLISPATYREMIKPYHSRLYQYVQNHYPSVKVFLHSCGAIQPLIPELIEAGVQILNPVQISATGMDPVMLKREYGRDLVFWGGGANMQVTALHGSVEDIRAEVRGLIEIFSKDSGYVFNQVHNIQANVPPEKILAIYDTALAYREEQRKK